MAKKAILACGAWLKNRACLVIDNDVLWSDLHGDLDTPESCIALETQMREWIAVYGTSIVAVAHDLHPDFFSSRLAQSIARELGVPAIPVQHHHAHIGVVMAEYAIQEPVIGLALDGVGLGTDGVAWGGELLLVGTDVWQRLGHLQTLALPGGDVAAREPWRMASAVLHALGRGDEIVVRYGEVAGKLAAQTVQAMLAQDLRCPKTTGAGRWFDAAAGALGISVRQTEEAQAAIALERLAQRWIDQHGWPDTAQTFVISAEGTLDLSPLFNALFAYADSPDPSHLAYGAAQFHAALVDALAVWAKTAAQKHHVSIVALGGGCFFNRIIRTHLQQQLAADGLRVLLPTAVSCGDDALALGQAWVGAQEYAAAVQISEGRVCA
jgi:hydrogenase maturation protein HypF